MFDTGSAWLRGVRIRGFRFLAEQIVQYIKGAQARDFRSRFFYTITASPRRRLTDWENSILLNVWIGKIFDF
jgi:hypothetical protein